jgi:hypothetical protein
LVSVFEEFLSHGFKILILPYFSFDLDDVFGSTRCWGVFKVSDDIPVTPGVVPITVPFVCCYSLCSSRYVPSWRQNPRYERWGVKFPGSVLDLFLVPLLTLATAPAPHYCRLFQIPYYMSVVLRVRRVSAGCVAN